MNNWTTWKLTHKKMHIEIICIKKYKPLTTTTMNNTERQLIAEFLDLVETWEAGKVEKFRNEVDEILKRKWSDEFNNL